MRLTCSTKCLAGFLGEADRGDRLGSGGAGAFDSAHGEGGSGGVEEIEVGRRRALPSLDSCLHACALRSVAEETGSFLKYGFRGMLNHGCLSFPKALRIGPMIEMNRS